MAVKEPNLKQTKVAANQVRPTDLARQEGVEFTEGEAALSDSLRIAGSDPGRLSPPTILVLQRSVGNRAVSGLLNPVNLTHSVQDVPFIRREAAGSQAGGMIIQRRLRMLDVGKGEYSGFGRLSELVERLNKISKGLTYSMNAENLTCKEKEGGTLSEFDRQMKKFIDSGTPIPLRLTNRQGMDKFMGTYYKVEADAWAAGYVDIDDLLASSDLGLQLVLGHFLTERLATPNYARRIGSPSMDLSIPGGIAIKDFMKAHALGIEAEVQVLRDYFGDPTIKYIPGAGGGQIFRVFRNSRKDRIRVRLRPGHGEQRGVDAVSIEVVTKKDGKTHTPEEYKGILLTAPTK